MKQITHDRVETVTHHGDRWWLVHGTLTQDDGTVIRHVHRMPAWVLEQRAAEYDIDPADVDTLIDIALWEPHLHVLADGFDHEHPKFLWNAITIDEARDHHLWRIAATKARLAHPDQRDGNPALDVMRRDHGIDPEVVALKTRVLDHHRRAHQATRASRMSAPEVDRRQVWQQRLDQIEEQGEG